ncbi:hypothetical protein Tco_0551190 [Tanacetum coccineum]
MSLTKAPQEEVARQVHAAHEWIVMQSEPKPARRRPLGIAFRDTLSVSKKISPDPSQKLKASRSQPHAEGSSKGTDVSPGVLDESTVILTTSSEGTGTKPGVLDEKRVNILRKTADEEVEWLYSDEEEEKKDDADDDRSIDLEKTNDEETDDEFVHSDEYVHDNVDEQIKDAEVADAGKVGNLKDTVDAEINSLLDPTVLSPIPEIPTKILATTLPPPLSVTTIIPVLQQSTPIPTPPIITVAPAVTTIPDPLPAIIQRVFVLEKDIQELKESGRCTSKALFDALLNSMCLDDSVALGQANPEKILRKRDRDDDNKDEDPPVGLNQQEPNEEPAEPTFEMASDDIEQTVDDVVNDVERPPEDATQTKDKAPKKYSFKQPQRYPLTFDELMATPIDFSKFAMNRLKIDKLTKAHLVRLVYKLLKGTCQSSVELEYHMEECYKYLSDQLDWNNPNGDRCPFDLSKPVPLKGRPGRLTVPSKYFFNNDLEYLKSSNPEKKYTTYITKTKAARYELVEDPKCGQCDGGKTTRLWLLEGDHVIQPRGSDIVDLVVAFRMFTTSSKEESRMSNLV